MMQTVESEEQPRAYFKFIQIYYLEKLLIDLK